MTKSLISGEVKNNYIISQKSGIMNGKGALLCAAALSVALVLGGCKKPQQQMNMGPAQVGFIVAQTAPVAMNTELPGRTSAYMVSDVRPQVGGIIQSRLFTEGSYVKKGQALYQINPAPLRAEYARALASLAQAKAGVSSVALKASRYAELIKINGVSKQENDDAQAALAQARAAVQAAEAAVQVAKINLNYATITAPISGRIGKSNVTPGALVTASQAQELARIQDISRVYLDINQSVNEMLALKAALANGTMGSSGTADVELIMEDGTVYAQHGKIQFSDVSVDEATGTVTLRAVFANPNGVLLPGMYAKARFSTGVVNNGFLIPQAGVSRDPRGNATVMVVTADNKVAVKPVTVSKTIGDKWLVTSGIQNGDRIVVDGFQKAVPGAPVKAVPASAAPAAPAGK